MEAAVGGTRVQLLPATFQMDSVAQLQETAFTFPVVFAMVEQFK